MGRTHDIGTPYITEMNAESLRKNVFLLSLLCEKIQQFYCFKTMGKR